MLTMTMIVSWQGLDKRKEGHVQHRRISSPPSCSDTLSHFAPSLIRRAYMLVFFFLLSFASRENVSHIRLTYPTLVSSLLGSAIKMVRQRISVEE